MNNYQLPLEPGNFYHIFNHANGNELLFRSDENYRFFLKKFDLYISPIAHTFAFCLMPNHFHFLVKIKDNFDESELCQSSKTLTKFSSESMTKLNSNPSKAFSNLFSCYTQSYNKMYKRMGNLFKTPFGRLKICNAEYLMKVICYVHQNPVHHNFVKNLEDWKYSSYPSFFTNTNTKLERNEVIGWFDNIENMKFVHLQTSEKYALEMQLTY